MSFDTIAVANEILRLAHAEGVPISHMKLQKLLFFAHGWHLAATGEPLINEQFEAWKYGPVQPSLYKCLNWTGMKPIKGYVRDKDKLEPFLPADASPESVDLIRRVYHAYKGATARQLSTLTHASGTPWDNINEAYGGNLHRNIPMINANIKRYFIGEARRDRATG